MVFNIAHRRKPYDLSKESAEAGRHRGKAAVFRARSRASSRSRAKGLLFHANFKSCAGSDQPLVQKKDLPCYFWRKSNQNVGVDTPAG